MAQLQLKGNQVQGLVRQTGDVVTQLADGTWEAEVIYVCRWANIMQLAPRRNIAAHPDLPGFLCNGCKITRLKPGIIAELRVTYRGFLGTNFGSDYGTQELISGVAEQPIETHPLFVSQLAGTKDAPITANGPIFNDDGTFAGWKADSPFAGVTSFLCPSTVYRKTMMASSFPGSVFDVGYITGTPVQAGGGRNWLLTSRTASQSGGVFTISEESTLSGPRGWDSIIYGG